MTTPAVTLAPTTGYAPIPDHPLATDPRGLLTQAVRVVTGLPDAQPRVGQAALHDAIMAAMRGRSHTVGQAPTGSGKSLASLAPAFVAALEHGERTIVSTDSLALMGQLQDKDVDTMHEAARALYGTSVNVAFLKGTGNYIDPDRVLATAQDLAGEPGVTSYDALAAELSEGKPLLNLHAYPNITPEELDAFRELVVWALNEYAVNDPNSRGDRHSCPVEHSAAMWAAVSASSAEASDGSAHGVTAKAVLAREQAAEADIVVTNHSILAVQAALNVPVIVGSARLGWFDHIIVDEAHTLPGHVRSQGAGKLSGDVIVRLARTVAKAAGNTRGVDHWKDAAGHLAEDVDAILAAYAKGAQGGVRRLRDGDDPIAEVSRVLGDWIVDGKKIIGDADAERDVQKRIQKASAVDALDKLRATMGAVSRHRSGWARWVEQQDPERAKGRPWWEANTSPIDVGFMLRSNLWTAPVTPDSTETDEQEQESEAQAAEAEVRVPLSVAAISATMPSNYAQQAGLDAPLVKYPSPFVNAYARSALFIPMVRPGDAHFTQVTSDKWGRAKFDVMMHEKWAAERIVDLVEAADGRALVLAATARGGKVYAELLRRRLPQLTIHSQWDGGSTTKLVRDWREEERSVLVGTRSFMTGIDVSGSSNSLVIIDRVPRSPSNPIDDARVEQLMERLGGDKWAADRHVYSIDAALLMKQAAGRLIRATDDYGMCVCLDPRLLKGTPLSYQEPTRNIYMEALRDFGVKLADLEQAKMWLRRNIAGA